MVCLVRDPHPRSIRDLLTSTASILIAVILFITLLVGCQSGEIDQDSRFSPIASARISEFTTTRTPLSTKPLPPSPTASITPVVSSRTPSAHKTPLINETPPVILTGSFQYIAQPGDTLLAVASHFGVQPQEVLSPTPLSPEGLLNPGQVLYLLSPPDGYPRGKPLLPDSEVIFSRTAVNFNIDDYLQQAGGYLKTYREYLVSTGWTGAAEVIRRVALENSINPRLLLAVLEYHCRCVRANPDTSLDADHLLGVTGPKYKGLYRQLGWVANQLSIGYYGWRTGQLKELPISDTDLEQIPPDLNAGTVALEYLFAGLYDRQSWEETLDQDAGFIPLYVHMFGDPWERDQQIKSLFPADLTQPLLILPFQPGVIWSYTSGPHKAWDTEGALAALDFAPPSVESGCQPSDAWILAMSNGLVTRAEFGAVVLDLDDGTTKGDGFEQTGWAILYMHVDSRDRVSVGTYLHTGDLIGHPSCEGGRASGTHVHIARKYNSEWMPADGPIPFTMDGWTVHAGPQPFMGTLIRGDQTITANPYGAHSSFIQRSIEDLRLELEFIQNRCLGQCD